MKRRIKKKKVPGKNPGSEISPGKKTLPGITSYKYLGQ
jgi:hypothetical protein